MRAFSVPGIFNPARSASGLAAGDSVVHNNLAFESLTLSTDVAGFDSLRTAAFSPVAKTLLLDLSTVRHDDGSLLATDNIEGLSWAPNLETLSPC